MFGLELLSSLVHQDRSQLTQTTDNAEPEYLAEPVSSNHDATSSTPTKTFQCSATQCQRELLSERRFHEQWPVLPPRHSVPLANIDENLPLASLEPRLLHVEPSHSARELRLQSREAFAESSFNQLHESLSDTRLEQLSLYQQKTRRSNLSLTSIHETEGILP